MKENSNCLSINMPVFAHYTAGKVSAKMEATVSSTENGEGGRGRGLNYNHIYFCKV